MSMGGTGVPSVAVGLFEGSGESGVTVEIPEAGYGASGAFAIPADGLLVGPPANGGGDSCVGPRLLVPELPAELPPSASGPPGVKDGFALERSTLGGSKDDLESALFGDSDK